MKKLFLIALSILIVIYSFSQDISGTWNGTLKVQGISLRVVFHIEKENAVYKATMDSPDQGAKGIPMSAASFENNKLTLELSSAGIKYVSTQIYSDSITGIFIQMGQQFPLNLYRKAKEPEKKIRPQEPLPPYPYNSVDIVFHNEKDNIQLEGTITYPAKKGKYPAVVLISGSGPQDRNEELLGHKPFLVLADYLTRNGYIVLRFDDRGTFKSGGDFKTATSFDFANDVNAAVKFLQSRPDVDVKNIG
jgi:dipeptidyl aminopeptidase/acylaminoacyl peptidase